MRRPNQTFPKFWRLLRSLATLALTIIALWSRLKPIAEPVFKMYHEYGFEMTTQKYIPAFYEYHILCGIKPLLVILCLVLAILHVVIASKAMTVFLTKAIFKLGFRAEEAGQHFLLHPRRRK